MHWQRNGMEDCLSGLSRGSRRNYAQGEWHTQEKWSVYLCYLSIHPTTQPPPTHLVTYLHTYLSSNYIYLLYICVCGGWGGGGGKIWNSVFKQIVLWLQFSTTVMGLSSRSSYRVSYSSRVSYRSDELFSVATDMVFMIKSSYNLWNILPELCVQTRLGGCTDVMTPKLKIS